MQLLIFTQANTTLGKKLKTCQERPHLVSGRFLKVFLLDDYLPKTTTFEWSQEWSSYTGLTGL